MEGWKVPGQPLKLSPVIPVVKVVENGRFRAPGQPLKLSPVIPVVKVVENGRLEGIRAATKAFSCHPSGEGCRNWKVGRDKGNHWSSPFIPKLKVGDSRRLEWTRPPLKLSPFIPVVKVVNRGGLEGTRAATKALLSSQSRRLSKTEGWKE